MNSDASQLFSYGKANQRGISIEVESTLNRNVRTCEASIRTLSLIVEGSTAKLLITSHSQETMILLSLRSFARSCDKRYEVMQRVSRKMQGRACSNKFR